MLLRALRVGVLVGLVAGSAVVAAQAPKAEHVADSVITENVKAALQKDPNFGGWRINVETVNGVVNISGFVASERDRERARDIVLGVRGVQAVKGDRLFVRTGGHR